MRTKISYQKNNHCRHKSRIKTFLKKIIKQVFKYFQKILTWVSESTSFQLTGKLCWSEKKIILSTQQQLVSSVFCVRWQSFCIFPGALVHCLGRFMELNCCLYMVHLFGFNNLMQEHKQKISDWFVSWLRTEFQLRIILAWWMKCCSSSLAHYNMVRRMRDWKGDNWMKNVWNTAKWNFYF